MLKNNDETIIRLFQTLSTKQELAFLLEVKLKDLIYFLYRFKSENKYSIFDLSLKNKTRAIMVPCKPLKILQSRLNYILTLNYSHHVASHGFVKSRSVVTNAQKHLKNKLILNLDIKDFFPSIHFGRVRGIFKSRPFNFNDEVATVLAQLCIFENQLPQGAPTSPFISNVICRRLDNDLCRLAKRNSCEYTRYADDITFSTNREVFLPSILEIKDGEIILSDELEQIFNQNDFKINRDKVRYATKSNRQEITGLLVNEKVNVKRKYIREIRAMLHSWEKYGELEAERYMHEKYYKKQLYNREELPGFKQVLLGKINYLRMVRGFRDVIYRKFYNKFQQLSGNYDQCVLLNAYYEEICQNLWVIESRPSLISLDTKQGTAFYIGNNTLVTCCHVLDVIIEAFQSDDTSKKYQVEVLKFDDKIDLALLKIKLDKSIAGGLSLFQIDVGNNIQQGMSLTIAGYPNYWRNDTPKIREAKVAGFRNHFDVKRIMLDSPIYHGDSGCPILNQNNEVIGVAVTGAKSPEDTKNTSDYGVIPVSMLRELGWIK